LSSIKTIVAVPREIPTALSLPLDPKNLLTWVRDYLHSGFLEAPPKPVILNAIRNERCMNKQVILELTEFFSI
jgi:hypothetical protein